MNHRAINGRRRATARSPQGEEVIRMKKAISKQAQQLEAAHWTALKKAVSEQPIKVCRK